MSEGVREELVAQYGKAEISRSRSKLLGTFRRALLADKALTSAAKIVGTGGCQQEQGRSDTHKERAPIRHSHAGFSSSDGR